MLKNYFKTALITLKSNKLFTGISLFGIAFTLMLLILVVSLYESNFGSDKPLTEKTRIVINDRGILQRLNIDTIYLVDTIREGSEITLDTTIKINKEVIGGWYEKPGYYMLDKYFRNVNSAQHTSFFTSRENVDVFLGDQKLEFQSVFTDAAYWDVFNFKFTEGVAYSDYDIENDQQVIVINTDVSQKLFGDSKSVIGNTLETQGKTYRVVGVVEPAKSFIRYVKNDIYFPLTQLEENVLNSENYLGGFTAAYLTKEGTTNQAVINEIQNKARSIPMPPNTDFDTLILPTSHFEASVANRIIPFDDKPEKAWNALRLIVLFLVILFIAVPTLNFINLNVSRVLERSSEIGVRKAFGATSGNIVYQLVFENLILTILGGIIGFLATLMVIYFINNSGFNTFKLTVNYKVLLYSILLIFLFGIISGILPALRTSKIHIVNALKNNQL